MKHTITSSESQSTLSTPSVSFSGRGAATRLKHIQHVLAAGPVGGKYPTSFKITLAVVVLMKTVLCR